MTAREAISGSHHPYAVEHRSQFDALRGACEAQGLALRAVVWDDPLPAVDEFDAVVVGTTWDYAARPAEFLAALREFDARWPLSNSLSTIEWNLEKTYLRDLAQRGVPVVETLWRDRIDRETLRTAFDELSTDEVVIKPVVGASSWRQQS